MKTSSLQTFESSEEAAIQDGAGVTPLQKRNIALIRDVPVNVTVVLGTATLTVERLFSLRPGEIIELDQSLDETVTFYMGDKPIARGHLVAVEDRYGIELAEIL